RAMGAATAVIAFDVPFNREVLDERAWFFRTADDAAARFEEAESDAVLARAYGDEARGRARTEFRWVDVADAYEDLARRLAAGSTVHPAARRAPRRLEDWEPIAARTEHDAEHH